MNKPLIYFLLILWSLPGGLVLGQVTISDDYLIVNAAADDPLFTTYAASPERSRFFADKAYFLDYFTPDKPITYSSQYAGDWAVIWKINNVVIRQTRDFARKPIVMASFPDMAVLEYEPFVGLRVQEVFFVFSSGAAIVDLNIQNIGNREFHLNLYPVVYLPDDSLRVVEYRSGKGYLFTHYESRIRLHSNLYADRDYPTHFRNLLAALPEADSYGTHRGSRFEDFYFAIKRMSKIHEYVRKLNEFQKGFAEFVALQKDFDIKPGETVSVRFVRGVQDARKDVSELFADVEKALSADLQRYVNEDVSLFARVPRIKFKTKAERMVYLGAFNLVRQNMLPPRGATKYNYYVFSRNPIWGWGHGHQVMHESLSMLTYAYMAPRSAEASQRIYIEQQYPDGLIPYRVGPRGPQVYPHEGVGTTSAPFFSWTNWEIYQVSKDKQFLKDAYQAGERYIDYLDRERDKDKDGMYEWGPYGIIENVRDGWNVVFQLFSEGEDEGRDISDELDALDLTTQVANEVYYLREMARELGDKEGEARWTKKFQQLKKLINTYMWDETDKFYYHVNMEDHTFNFEGKSLKRKEIIGFLPMWARVATKERARELVKHLTDPNSFWRKYGVPTLAADDPNYTPFVDGCCRWNGPVWLLWDYMVLNGLKNYGYHKLAKQLAEKMMLAVTTQLKKNHRFWESYSPDYPVQESPSNYIWDSIMARVLFDIYRK